jgi:purine-nucleoside phosphorylase
MYAQAKRFLTERLRGRPEIGVVLGSGLGGFATELEDATSIPYAEIPGWPRSTAEGHAGNLVYGKIEDIPCVVMSGRTHLYEGYAAARVTFGVRVMKLLGIRALVLTCAAGGINTAYAQGALVLISDHINLQGANALVGANEEDFGPRFPDMTEAYSKRLRDLALIAAGRQRLDLHEGVYAAVLGPSYETPAEIRYLRTIGADLVGMSTVQEAIVAAHMGLPVLAIACVTNMAAGILPQRIRHEEVLETGRRVQEKFVRLLRNTIPEIARDGSVA